MFELIDLDSKISKTEYKSALPRLQTRLLELQQICWQADVGSLIVVEGWDASGKGPVIRKLTERLEPRGFDLQHITDEPRTWERDLPWMWRFWQALPAYGKMAIFDRSWIRRLLVERVQHDADELRWRRGIRDIKDFEQALSDDGYVFAKLFLHIDKREQKKRYEAWKKTPGESWKSLEGDWQEPTHYDEYLSATEEVLQHTEAAWAPWTIIPATDRRFAGLRVFETVIETLEEALQRRGVDSTEVTNASMTAPDRDSAEASRE